MLKKANRLTKNEFDRVFSDGKSVRTSIGRLKVLRGQPGKKLSCTISKKVVKNSVDRTRVRRRGYAAVEESLDLFPADTWMIWFLPANAQDTAFEELTEVFRESVSHL